MENFLAPLLKCTQKPIVVQSIQKHHARCTIFYIVTTPVAFCTKIKIRHAQSYYIVYSIAPVEMIETEPVSFCSFATCVFDRF